jgi:Flp pilus assembly protein TadD
VEGILGGLRIDVVRATPFENTHLTGHSALSENQARLNQESPMVNSLKLVVVAASIVVVAQAGWARGRDTIAITIPLHSRLSLVQRLNRDGVELTQKKQFDKAEQLFLKAYLYDPADPFTLNNLGYIAELQGQLDRAHKFYELASEQSCNAAIDRSSVKELEGKPMRVAIDGLQNSPMRVNSWNVEAIRLLKQNRGDDALALLKQALKSDLQNPFTLNNLGVASEATGDYQSALRYYQAVASQHSTEAVIVTDDHVWGGKSVSDMAAASAKRLKKLMEDKGPDYTQAAMFDRRGVAAINHNDWNAARKEFLRAYSLDPSSAFSLNNRGYVAEMDGDLETAQLFYEKAAKATDADEHIGLATKSAAQGERLFMVAGDSNSKVDGALEQYSEQRHQQTAPIELTPRGAASTDDTAPLQNKRLNPNGSQTPDK